MITLLSKIVLWLASILLQGNVMPYPFLQMYKVEFSRNADQNFERKALWGLVTGSRDLNAQGSKNVPIETDDGAGSLAGKGIAIDCP